MNTSKTQAWRAVLGIILVILLVSAAMLTHAESTGTVRGSELHLRIAPDQGSESLGVYPIGTEVTIFEGEVDGWYLVRTPEGNEGYMEARYVFTGNQGILSNGDDVVNLREEPSMEAEILGVYGSGTVVLLLSEDEEGWAHVSIDDVQGYMAMTFIAPLPAENVEVPAQSILMLGDSEGILNSADAAGEVNPAETLDETTQGDESLAILDKVVESAPGENPSYLVEYPWLDIQQADAQIQAWVDSALEEAKEAAQSAGAVELTAQYDVAMLADRYMGVLATGFLSGEALAHPTDMILTLNVDRETGGVLTYQDIFTGGGMEQAVSMLSEKLSQVEGNPLEEAEAQPEEAWLKYAVLRQQGVAIVLPRSEYLPSVWGTQTVLLPYTELKEAGLLALPIEAAPLEAVPVDSDVVGSATGRLNA